MLRESIHLATQESTGVCRIERAEPAGAVARVSWLCQQQRDTLRRTPLHERHVAAGARLVPYAGWEMPVQYEGIRQEHIAVRRSAGLFDVSHMGQVETSGPDAEAFLQHLVSNDVTKIAPHGAQYSVLCREDGGVLDDLFTYRLDDELPDRDQRGQPRAATCLAGGPRGWLRSERGGRGRRLRDARAPGPRRARDILGRHLDGEAPARMRIVRARVAGVDCLVAGTGYTGEDGVELLIPPAGAAEVWDALVADGALPVGLGARDTLRLEACFHLYGNDLSEDRNPIEAGLGWCCKLDTGFIGSEALRGVDPEQTLVPFAFTGPGIPRQGNPVLVGGEPAGVVTSGTLSPCLELGIGMAYVPVGAAEPGTPIEVDVRGKLRPAEVREKPLYRKEQ